MISGYSRAPAGAGGAGPVIEQSILAYDNTTNNNNSYTTGNITTTSQTNHLLIGRVNMIKGANTSDLADIAATFNGTSMTKIAEVNNGPAGRRICSIIFALAAPSVGSYPMVITTTNANMSAIIVEMTEISGADQTVGSYPTNTDDNGATNVSGLELAVTTLADNALLLSVIGVESGGSDGEWSATNGGTLDRQTQTGITTSSDCCGGVVSEEVASAGADGHGVSWTTANETSGAIVSVEPA